jgi:hypothetical protein
MSQNDRGELLAMYGTISRQSGWYERYENDANGHSRSMVLNCNVEQNPTR